MASDAPKTTRIRPGLAIGAGVMGAVTASIGIVAPAQAVDYPSWNDVQQAKANVANQQAMISDITTLIGNLQSSVDAARVESEKAAEAYFQAKDALDRATAKEADLEAQASAAAEKAKTSQMRAGLLASHLAKSGGGDVSTELLLKGGGSESAADKLLFQLGTMSKLTEQSKAVYDQATKDKNTAQSLTAQAQVAKTERAALADKATAALAAAQDAQAKAQAAFAEQQTKSTELIAQLATLKNTSSQVEAAYLQGEQVRAQQAAAAAAAAKAAEEERRRQQEQQGGGGGGGDPVSPPQGNVVQAAISYAQAQLGKPYIFGGEGPVGYDCSGLTMKAYAYAGVYIGSHSVNNQWYTAANRGQIVPYSQRQRGDLIFWGSGPGSFYHVGIYLGDGTMIAAPTEGDVVKIQSVWGSPWGQVARPSA
ncbi:peptidoglycan lytic protein P45 [Leifsonia xyli subsp. cynodontis DSM 46306]|uniref:NlpC/P60 domain-containing protein n=1 Tax=Leifsonia xyli subsp. cynodontis DSM 46306 TaxID=1389489 RepID=U3P2M7_LEIXC|nr:C40 family peptidase [Leifsonia xyli]AGW40570.1 peptidoglycan lytic protein P45 [Leifsonia xyli subsp. cynodontis DSM 46306]